jgi:hypothetical protein
LGRHARKSAARHRALIPACLAALLVAFSAVFIAVGSASGGATLVSTDGVTTLATTGTVTPGPYTSGQAITITGTANSTLSNANLVANAVPGQATGNPTGAFYFEECADPGGTVANLPTTSSGCEAATVDFTSVQKDADGSFDNPSYTVYDLPDLATLGNATMVGTCDVAPNTCVIGIFAENPGTTGFSYPHLFSAPFNIEVGDGQDLGDNPGDGTAATSTPPASTSLSTSLSGGDQSGTSISVPTGTAVTDTATLSGTNASTATGTVTYNVYTDTGCTTLASGGGGTAETISTPGTLPASSPVTLSSAGTYYWGVTYSGDTNNATSTSTCGTAGEVATVTSTSTPPASTRLKTRLMVNGGHSGRQFGWGGPSVTVFAGTSLTDTAGLTGANAAQATGTVTYSVYTRQFVAKNGHRTLQWVMAANAGTVTVTAGQVPHSNAVSLPIGLYEWQAVYSGDSANQPSSSRFGSEIEIVVPLPRCYAWYCAGGASSSGRFLR